MSNRKISRVIIHIEHPFITVFLKYQYNRLCENHIMGSAFNQLLQYGIKGKNYDLNEEGRLIQPASFDEAKDGYGMSTWAIRADENVIPNATDYPGAADLYANYNTFAFQNPYNAFSFDKSKVSNELASIGQINAGIGLQILFGKVADPVAAIEDYRSQLKQAGIDKVMDEIKAQIESYTPVK